MHRYKVTLIGKIESFYADCYVEIGGLHQFYHGDTVVKEYKSNQVLRVIKIY